MRNIWGWVIGIVLVAGASITIMNFIGESPRRAAGPPPAPATAATRATGETAATDAAQAAATVPRPSATFTELNITPEDNVLGRTDAPVTLIEYASFTCPYCAEFHSRVLPSIKTEFIDTGKVRLIFRDYPLDRVALAASMIARCAGRERYFGFVDAFFAAQSSWARDPNPIAALGRIAKVGGMTDADVDVCLQNSAVEEAVLKQRIEAEKSFDVRATPTLIISGDKYGGGVTLEQFRAIIAKKLDKS